MNIFPYCEILIYNTILDDIIFLQYDIVFIHSLLDTVSKDKKSLKMTRHSDRHCSSDSQSPPSSRLQSRALEIRERESDSVHWAAPGSEHPLELQRKTEPDRLIVRAPLLVFLKEE